MNKLVIKFVEDLPHGRPLETPLHPKRKRSWQPADQGQPSRATSSAAIQRSRRRRLSTQSDYAKCDLNYGSESSPGESDDEEEIAVPFLPRRVGNVFDTPVEVEDSHEPTAASATTEYIKAEVTETELAWTSFDFNWEDFPSDPIPPESRREIFSQKNVGPQTPCVDPYDIFIAIWDRQIMEHIALETNKYAQTVASQLANSNKLGPNSRISRWQDTNVDELYVYFGMMIAMGILVKSSLQEYWNTTADIFFTPGFNANMSINRFVLLTKCLHFNDNNEIFALELDVTEAKLYKIMPIITHLNRKFQTMYTLSQNISLDESLLRWKGSLDINQLIPNKAAVMGIKTYEICESQTGYLWRFEIHAHKKSPPQQLEDPLKAFTPALVLRLLHGLENMGYTVWMDSFYNSPALARRLKSLGFDCVGTLRTNRKFVPQELHSLTKDKMRQGELTGLTSGDVDVMVWKDNNRVGMISTYHGNSVCTNEGSTKPILILDYNIMMGGVDKKDQMLPTYPMEKKRMKVWYKKLFRRLLNVSVLNSYIIHKHSSSFTSALSHRNFRISLVNTILSIHCTKPSLSYPIDTQLVRKYKRKGRANVANSTQKVHVDLTHRISLYPIRESQLQRIRRQCNVCKKKVSTFCVGCDTTVCIDTCFIDLHNT